MSAVHMGAGMEEYTRRSSVVAAEIFRVSIKKWAVCSLVVRASNSKPAGLGSMPDATKYPPSTHGFYVLSVEVEIGGVTIYRLLGEFRRADSYSHLYGHHLLSRKCRSCELWYKEEKNNRNRNTLMGQK
ncbi:hypothetical protein TNCV_4794551 [Trichonephila clavipes]|nr:hypothetical protein TNCV_4794551 [Trichonephila clavipes]